MVGTIARSELSSVMRPAARGAVRFALAMPADDAAIRRLLRENPTRGAISVSFEREPDFFARPTCWAADDQTIVAHQDDRLVCIGRCTVRERFVNGERRRVGYLGELRLDARARRGVEILRGGYQFFRELQGDAPADVYFTSIAADNDRARRVLERGLPGLPRYEFLTEFVTVLIPCDYRTSGCSRDAAKQRPYTQALLDLFNARATRHQLATFWTTGELGETDDLVTIRDGSDIVAAAALCDQRAWRQTVIRGYSRSLAVVRPLTNLLAPLFHAPRLPRIGETVPAAFLSPLATVPGHEHRLPDLIRAAFVPARARGVELLTVGFAAVDSRLAIVRREFRSREYRSRLYRVGWPADGNAGITFDDRLFLPEVALL